MIKVIKKIFDCILVLIIVILSIYLILKLNNRVEIYNVETGSMEDNIHAGDYILTLKKDKYEVGDIITFRKEHYLITHRIIEEADGKFITKGDANNTVDEPVSTDYIVGKVIIIGGILNFVLNYKYILIEVFLALYLLSCYFDKSNDKKIDNKEEKIENNE